MAPKSPRDEISDLYHRALACAPEARRAFLIHACGANQMLLEEVQSLLEYEAGSSGLLEAPGMAVSVLARMPGKSQMVPRQVGAYRIIGSLGAGGMGEVYRARDDKLGRDVAIKILPLHLTADPDRRARFAREARLLAALNHPHIGAIYELEEVDGISALVLELVEGSTLADCLAQGPLPIAAAVAIARQVADALDAAHEKGIVHRDLKPANIVIQGTTIRVGPLPGNTSAKILDFGLAKTLAPGLDGDLTQRPSGSLDGTAEGQILGTPAYMSPEQARGQVVDKRTDIWSFGCILFEMLSGRRAFDGDTISDTFVSILEREPDWTALPAATPPSVRTLLERCLRKDPRTRLHDIADARIELEDGANRSSLTRSAADSAPPTWRRSRGWLGWIAAAALVVTVAGTTLLKNREPQLNKPDIVEFPLVPPEGVRFKSPPEFAVSPDGRYVVFVASSKAGSLLWVRSLAAVDSQPLPGTEGARNPFWSPDSQSIGFFANNQLKTIEASGRSTAASFPWSGSFHLPAETGGVAPAGTWGRTGVIVFGPSSEGDLYQIDVKKKTTATPVTKNNGTTSVFRRPRFLQDGQHFLYSCMVGATNEIRAGSLTTADTVVIGSFASPVAYATQHLFFVRDGNFMVQALNEKTLHLTGDPIRLAARVSGAFGTLPYSVSDNGLLAFLSPVSRETTLTWKDRSGRVVGTLGDPGVMGNLDLSPDGRRLAIAKVLPRPEGGTQTDIWLIDVASGRATPLTDDPAADNDPSWSPDGKYIVFNSTRLGLGSLFIRASDGSAVDVLLVTSETHTLTVANWSRSGILMFNAFGKGNPSNLWLQEMSADPKPKPFVASRHSELNAAFSLDGRWVAYQSDASGRYEVMVRPFPNKDPASAISRDGGMYPRWREDGKELFFVSLDGWMMAAGFDPVSGQATGVPQRLWPTEIGTYDNHPYAVDKNGQRFLLLVGPEQRVIAVTNWRALLDR